MIGGAEEPSCSGDTGSPVDHVTDSSVAVAVDDTAPAVAVAVNGPASSTQRYVQYPTATRSGSGPKLICGTGIGNCSYACCASSAALGGGGAAGPAAPPPATPGVAGAAGPAAVGATSPVAPTAEPADDAHPTVTPGAHRVSAIPGFTVPATARQDGTRAAEAPLPETAPLDPELLLPDDQPAYSPSTDPALPEADPADQPA